MEVEILKSEDHLEIESLQGAIQAKRYLEQLLTYADGGLLEHDIIKTINKKLFYSFKGQYSNHHRMTTYKGHVKIYCHPQEIYARMQTIIDRFNEKCCYQNTVSEALAEFVFDFLEIHPFSDGNGRTVKFIVWYALKGFKRLNTFYCLDYHLWCEIIHHNRYKSMLEWLENMQ